MVTQNQQKRTKAKQSGFEPTPTAQTCREYKYSKIKNIITVRDKVAIEDLSFTQNVKCIFFFLELFHFCVSDWLHNSLVLNPWVSICVILTFLGRKFVKSTWFTTFDSFDTCTADLINLIVDTFKACWKNHSCVAIFFYSHLFCKGCLMYCSGFATTSVC